MKKGNNWFEFAKDDLIVARASLEKEVYNLACFHAHQGVEKMLKGYLSAEGKDIPKTHFIGVLLNLCAEINQEFKNILEKCIKLDDYYIPTRYPDALPGTLPDGLPGKEDAQEAISTLEEAMDFVRKGLAKIETV